MRSTGKNRLLIIAGLVILLCAAAGCVNFNAAKAGGSGSSGDGMGEQDYSRYGSPGGGYHGAFPPDQGIKETWQLTLSASETGQNSFDFALGPYSPESKTPPEQHKGTGSSAGEFELTTPVTILHARDPVNGEEWYDLVDTREFPAHGTFQSQDHHDDAVYEDDGSLTDGTGTEDISKKGSFSIAGVTFSQHGNRSFISAKTVGETDDMFQSHSYISVMDSHAPNGHYHKWVDHQDPSHQTWGGFVDLRCSSDDDDGTEFDGGTHEFRYTGSTLVIHCHMIDNHVENNASQGHEDEHYNSPSVLTREYTLKATLTPLFGEKKPLKAIPGGPYGTTRGTPLQLDGSKSTGLITEYRWTFTPSASCTAGISLGTTELKGPGPQVTLLCPVTATLTVTDDRNTDSASIPITVDSRGWRTGYTLSPEGTDKSPLAGPPWFDNPWQTGYEGGANICGLCEGTANENTNLHPPVKDGSWEKSGGYVITRISEPDGPFDGYWYVSEYHMQMNRKIVINPYILPLPSGGRELPYSLGSFYQNNIDKKYPADKYLEGVRQHEQDHTGRMKAALLSVDPADDIEQLFEKNHNDVQTRADAKLRETEKTICIKSNDASNPPMRVTWTGKLVFPLSDQNAWKEGTTSVGGYRKDAGESCG
jgi:hypothetical protein